MYLTDDVYLQDSQLLKATVKSCVCAITLTGIYQAAILYVHESVIAVTRVL